MSTRPLRVLATALLAPACAALLAACGSTTTTVTAASAPTQSSTATVPASTPASTTGTATSTTPAPPASTSESAAQSTARTAPEPAFTQQETHAEGLTGALATVRSLGYTPQSPSGYHSGQTLRVLVGTRASTGRGQLAFFFDDNHYLGTDVRVPSTSISIASQGETEVTVAYALFRQGSPAGQSTVRFQLNNGRLQALDPIPPALSSTAPARN